MTVETHFGRAAKCFDFFEKLGPNTDIHWSKEKKEFVLTGGAIPGCATVANFRHGYQSSDIVKKINKIATELFTMLSLAAMHPEQYQSVINIRDLFTRAVFGVSSYDRFGGFQGLTDLYVEEKPEIERLILTIDEKLEETLEILSDAGTVHQLIPETDSSADFYTDEDWEVRINTKPAPVDPSYSKFLFYIGSLVYNVARQFTWWNEVSFVETEKFYLGALPLIVGSRNDCDILSELGVKAVLSLVESFEIYSKGVVSPDEWKNKRIIQLHISTPDFKPLTMDNINLGVEFLRWNVKHSRSVYVHCKAGKARSALILICYLIKVHDLTVVQALNHILKRRPQIHLDEGKLKNAKQYELWCKHKKEESTVLSPN